MSMLADKYGIIDGILKILGRVRIPCDEQNVTVMYAIFRDLRALRAILEEEDKRGKDHHNQPGKDV